MKHHLKGGIEVAIASAFFGLIGIFVKLIQDMSAESIIFYRLLFGSIGIVLYLLFCNSIHEIKPRKKKKYLMLLGIFQASAMFSYFSAIIHTNVSVAVLLLYTAPVYVILLSPLLLNESISKQSWLALILSMSGVVLVIQPQHMFQEMLGIAAGMLSGIFYALMIITSRYLRKYYTGVAQAHWAFIITMIMFFPYAMVSYDILYANLHLLILFGLLPTAIGAVLYLNGLHSIKAQTASIIGLIEPISAVLFAFIILKEIISYITMVGGGLILAGAILASREPISKAKKDK